MEEENPRSFREMAEAEDEAKRKFRLERVQKMRDARREKLEDLQPVKPKVARFCHLISLGMPQAQAYIEAGYKPGNAKQAHEGSSKLARQPDVQKYLAELQEAAYLANVLSLAEKRSFLADITRTPVGKVSLDSPLANSARYHDGELVEIRMPDKIKALELDAKLAGELRNDGTINIGLQLVNQRLEAMQMPATLLPE